MSSPQIINKYIFYGLVGSPEQQTHLYLALGQVRVRCQPLPQTDVRVGSHREGLFQLRQLRSAEDRPLPFPLALHQTGGSVRLRGGHRALTPAVFKTRNQKTFPPLINIILVIKNHYIYIKRHRNVRKRKQEHERKHQKK